MWYPVLLSFVISFFIGYMQNAGTKITLASSFAGGIAYAVFLLCPSPKAGYFFSALTLTIVSEICARKFKTPSTLFIIIGIYPIVPGAGLYETVLRLIKGDTQGALALGGETLIYITLIAVAVAFVSAVFKLQKNIAQQRRAAH